MPKDAKLYVDNVFIPLKSKKRTFRTPQLRRGRTYFYTVKAKMIRDGKAVTQKRKVYVRAGKRVNIRFKDTTLVSTAHR
jgi:uncharacterized protein (TIGR03000 family)